MEQEFRVSVENNTGTNLMLMGRQIKPLREFVGQQDFSFEYHFDAQSFADAINERNQLGMSAVVSVPDSELESSTESVRIDSVATVDVPQAAETSTTSSEESSDSLVNANDSYVLSLKDKTVKELRAECKRLGLSGYSSLKENELITLLTQRDIKED